MAFSSFPPTYPPAVASPPLISPEIPVIAPVPQPMQIGQMIRIKGTILPYAPKFHINLAMEGSLEASIALHINPRFDGYKSEIVRNSLFEGKWGKEEDKGPEDFTEKKKAKEYPLLMSPGGPFECLILVHSDCYRIAFNGSHFCEFDHRYDKDLVSHLVVEGPLTIDAITFEGPLPHMRGEPVPAGPPVCNLPIPYKQEIVGGLHEDQILYVSGVPFSPSYNGFAINLMVTQETNIDVAFHFNPRLEDEVVVRNSLTGVTWEKEDRSKPKLAKNATVKKLEFPFPAGQYFDIAIVVEEKAYTVSVNGQYYCKFPHKIKNLRSIRWMEIDGELELCNVTVA